MSEFKPKATLDGFITMLNDMERQIEGKARGVEVPFGQVGRNLTPTGTFELGTTTIAGGPPGNGKTFLALAILIQAVLQGMRAIYLPFEMTHAMILRRAYALLAGTWDVLSDDKDKLKKFIRAADEDNFLHESLKSLSNAIANNDMMPEVVDGEIFIKDVYAQSVVEWFAKSGANYDMVIIDPISMLNFSSGKAQEWQGQQEFMRYMPGIANTHKCHLFLIAHTGKRQTYKGKHVPISMDSIMGSAALTRFVDNILLLDFCRDGHRTSLVKEISGLRRIDHKRTLIIEKARNAGGTGAQFACDFTEKGPDFEIHGLIVPDE